MKKRLVSILLVLVMVLGMLPTVAFAADTAATRISTEAEFVAMEAGGNYILDTDITITKPHSGDFQGHFDGNGYTITLSGMTSSPFGIVNGEPEGCRFGDRHKLSRRYCRYGQHGRR